MSDQRHPAFLPNLKPERSLLEPSIYPFTTDIATRFQDLDMLGHINNVSMAGMFEEARYSFGIVLEIAKTLEGGRIVVGSVQLHYLAESFHGSPIWFGIGIGYIGQKSWRIRCLACQNDRPVMVGDASIVHSRHGATAPLPLKLREGLEHYRLKVPDREI